MKNTNEEWKDIPGWEGYFQASNLGRIRCLERNYKIAGYNVFHLGKRKSRILTLWENDNGYMMVDLCVGGFKKHFTVHRLVTKAFIPNPDNLPCINHKDENPKNNYIHINPDGSVDLEKSNLEWCTYKHNSNWGSRNEKMVKNRGGKSACKQVLQYTLDGEFVAEYPSAAEAGRKIGVHVSGITFCCRGKYKQAYGYIWKYE